MESNEQNCNNENFDEISFEDIWNIFVRRWIIIVACVVTALGSGYLYYSQIVPIYKSSSTLLIQVPASSSLTSFDPMGNYSASEKWASTYAQMILGEPVLSEVSKQINYPTFTTQDLKSSLSVSVVPDTMLLDVSFSYTQPSYAKIIVDTVNQIFINKVNEMYESNLAAGGQKLKVQIDQMNDRIESLTQGKDNVPPDRRAIIQEDIEAQYRIRAYLTEQLLKIELQEKQFTPTVKVYQEGTKPQEPINKNFMLIIAICLVLGLFVGVLIAFLYEYLDDTIKSESDLKKITDKRVLGNIYYYNPKKERKDHGYYVNYQVYKNRPKKENSE